MSLPIEFTFNADATTLRREGFALSKSAKAFRGAILRPDATQVTGYRYMPAELGEDQVGGIPIDDPGVYQFPESGVLQLKPSPLRPDIAENTAFEPFWMKLNDFRYRTYGVPTRSEILEIPQNHIPSKPRVLTIQREDVTDLVGIVPTSPHLAALDIGTRFSLIWLAESNVQLYQNEGISFFIRPFGTVADRAAALFGVNFGYRWFLSLNMAGGAALYEYTGTDAGGKQWVRRKQFGFAQGGVDPTQSFQLTIIPHQADAISFLFSQAAQGNPAVASDYKASVSTGFLYECRKNGFEPPYSSSMKQHIKTESAPIVLATRKDKYQLGMMIARVRYLPAGFTLTPEVLDEPKPAYTPALTPIGYYGQNRAGEPGTKIQYSKTDTTSGAKLWNGIGGAWTPAKDTHMVATAWLKPSGFTIADAVYSPEVWAMEYEVPAETAELTGASFPMSEEWYKLSGRLSSHPDTDVLEARLRRTSDWLNLYKLDGPVELKVDGYKLFDGEIGQYRPSLDGAFDWNPDGSIRVTPELIDDMEATGFWESMNDTSASHFLSLTNRSYGELIEKLLKLRGDTAPTIDIAAELYSLRVEGWESANDFKTTNENSSCGDVARLLIMLYGVQGNGIPRDLRIVRRDGISKAFLSPVYDPLVVPTHVFYLHTRCLPAAAEFSTDEERYAGVEGVKYWKAFSKPEIVRRRSDYNAVKSYCSVGTGEGSDMLAAFISAHPDALSNPDFWDYQGRVRSRTFGPNENATASTLNELYRITRRRYDTEGRPSIVIVLDAEYQPGKIDTDEFVIVAIPSLVDDEDRGIITGDTVTLGAFRVVEIPWEIDLSPPSDDPAAETVDLPAQDFTVSPGDDDDGNSPLGGGYPDPADTPTPPTGVEMQPLTGMIGSSARRASWQARYVLEYVGEVVSDDYPMFSTVLPDYGRAPAE